jgi:hypothetical protein
MRKQKENLNDESECFPLLAADGMSAFRHWFTWSTIETAPERFEWDDDDTQFDSSTTGGNPGVLGARSRRAAGVVNVTSPTRLQVTVPPRDAIVATLELSA